MKRATVAIGTALMLTGLMHANAEQPVSITVRPAVTTCRAGARLRVFIARDDKNRQLRWEVDGPDYYRSSVRDLPGAGAARIYDFMLREMPEGEYEIRATLIRNDLTTAMDRRTIRVVGSPGDF